MKTMEITTPKKKEETELKRIRGLKDKIGLDLVWVIAVAISSFLAFCLEYGTVLYYGIDPVNIRIDLVRVLFGMLLIIGCLNSSRLAKIIGMFIAMIFVIIEALWTMGCIDFGALNYILSLLYPWMDVIIVYVVADIIAMTCNVDNKKQKNVIMKDFIKCIVVIFSVTGLLLGCVGWQLESFDNSFHVIQEKVSDYDGNNLGDLYIKNNRYYQAVVYETDDFYITTPIVLDASAQDKPELAVSDNKELKYFYKDKVTLNYYEDINMLLNE